MSRCVSCNCILTSREMTIKGALSGHFLDMCKSCLKDADIDYEENPVLSDSDAPYEFEEEEKDESESW